MEDDIRERLDRQQYREAFELLVGRFKEKIFCLAFSLLHDEALAEDMTQETLLKVWRHLSQYNGQAALGTWIYTIARNTCLTELKKRSTRPTVSLHAPELEAVIDTLPAMQCADAEAGARQDAQALVARLPEHYRRAITLFYLEQKSYEDVAAMLGLPLGTVKTYLFRARKELLRLASPPALSPRSIITCHAYGLS